jgi:pyruvate dehydrogenase E1 component
MGALLPEALAAAERLTSLGESVDVVCVTSPGLLVHRDPGTVRPQQGRELDPGRRVPGRPRCAAAHRPRWTSAHAGLLGRDQPGASTHLGVTAFGQSGDLDDVYRHHQLDTDSIIAAGLDLLG